MSRYAHPCPVCGVIIPPGGAKRNYDLMLCPSCGAQIKFDAKYAPFFSAASFLLGPFLSWHIGYRGWVFTLVAICITFILCLLGIWLEGFLIPPAYKSGESASFSFRRKPFERVTSLRLTDKSNVDKKPSS
jgi:hypothetical protein